MIAPYVSHDLRAMLSRDSSFSCRSTSAATRSPKLRISRDQDGGGKFVMLRLGEEIGGDMGRGAAAVVDDQDLARTGDHVDPDLAEDQLLGGGHIDVAGAGDLVHPRHGRRAVGQSRHGLGPADAENPVHPGKPGRHQHMGVDLAARGRGNHDDLADTGHPGRHGIHDDA